MSKIAVFLSMLSIFFVLDCGNEKFTTAQHKDNGLVIILPGIEGESGYNHDIRRGLIAGGVFRSMPIRTWSRPLPLVGTLITQIDFLGNYIAGAAIADMIIKYQDEYPGRPVHIIGHSGGGGIAVFAAQALEDKAPDKKIDGIILLHASISADYDLTKALKHCKKGILNYYNPDDTGLLGLGTAIFGNVDGGRGASAGRTGFSCLRDDAQEEDKILYEKLFQVEIFSRMMAVNSDAHGAATDPRFVAIYVADWILTDTIPD